MMAQIGRPVGEFSDEPPKLKLIVLDLAGDLGALARQGVKDLGWVVERDRFVCHPDS